jgi:ABC-2 type transport system permease protein
MEMLKLIGKFMQINFLNELQYRANFFMQLFNSMLGLAFGLVGLAIVFHHTEHLAGWSQVELLAVLGVYLIITGYTGVIIQPNMMRLMGDIHRGNLDFMLIKPVDAQFLTSSWQLEFWKLLDILLGAVVLGFAIFQLGGTVGILQAMIFGLMLLCGGLIVYSFWLVLTCTAFWFIQIWGILQLFESIYQAGRWPVTIYPTWLRLALTFVVPVAFAVTIPTQALTDRLNLPTLILTLVLTLTFLTASRLVWKVGVRRYSGASA